MATLRVDVIHTHTHSPFADKIFKGDRTIVSSFFPRPNKLDEAIKIFDRERAKPDTIAVTLYENSLVLSHCVPNLTVDEHKARDILGDMIQPNNSLFTRKQHVAWPTNENHQAELDMDGEFSLEQIQAIAWWIENKDICQPSTI